MTPIYFEECFGWFHAAGGTRGVVICPAFGVEELIAHRFLKGLADEIASIGFPVLRFDYRGTGDSLGNDTDPDRLNDWLASIRYAVNWLRREAGVSDVVLVGFRLGGLLATCAATQLENISALILIGTIISGKAYVREMKALATINTQSSFGNSSAAQLTSTRDFIEVVGFQLTNEAQEALRKIDLTVLSRCPAERVLLLGGGESLGEDRLAESLRQTGCIVDRQILPGYANFEWHAVFAKLPADAFTGLLKWLQEMPSALGSIQSDNSREANLPSAFLHSEKWREFPVRFGQNGNLFGVYCCPHVSSKTVVIFANDGPNRHIGSARMFVTLARRLAFSGVASFRMDIAGVGDSPPHPGQSANQLYYRGSQRDVSEAIDWLSGKGYSSYVVVGHCAGAHLSFYTSIRDPRVTAAVMLNLQKFFWERGLSAEMVMRGGEFRASSWYVAMIKNPKTLGRLVRGEINIKGVYRELVKRLWANICSSATSIIGQITGRDDNRHKLMRWFRELSQRGTKVLLVYSANDPGLDELTLHGGSKGQKILLLPNVTMKVIDGADHSLTQSWAIEQYAEALETFLRLH